MEETTLTDHTDMSIKLQVFAEIDIKALDTVQQADWHTCYINRDNIAERLGSGDFAEDNDSDLSGFRAR